MLDASGAITETTCEAPRSGSGAVRQKMHHDLMAHHHRGDVQACALRASDFYGPGVTASTMGERVFGDLVKRKAAQLLVRADAPHSVAYIGDVGGAMATLGMAAEHQPSWGKVWLAPHAPAQTREQIVQRACALLDQPIRFSIVAPWMIRLAGLFYDDTKASIEMQ
jgi:nucleoside-diphosphate-sugar epimerase